MTPNDETKELVKKIFPDIDDKEITTRLAMTSRLCEKAIKKGDPKAFETIRDTAGEKPKDNDDPDKDKIENIGFVD